MAILHIRNRGKNNSQLKHFLVKNDSEKKYLFLAICRQYRQIHKERMEKESVWMKNTKQANEENDAEKDSRDRYF